MNSSTIVLVIGFSLTFALVASTASDVEKDNKAKQECNVTNPINRDIFHESTIAVTAGKKLNFSHEEKCFFNCFLQKVGFLNNNSEIRSGSGLVNYTLRTFPEFIRYSDIIIANIFQINRSTKEIEDKCQKAFVIKHQFFQSIFVLIVANGLRSYTDVRDKIVDAVEKGTSVDQHRTQQVQEYLKMVDAMYNYAEKS